ncbi:helix-turn-helix transcriptional regulator [Brachyspira hyodysenteriae]|nr:helix-turn-helix transcriptional regulator [Brachyspira hyodysenteriae]MDA1470310.1 helix-turn-helix transcriptional regulator [Brachyspira hyodysenteriae]
MKTISEIAEVSGISSKYLQGVEVGKRNISITNLNKIAKTWMCQLLYFLVMIILRN